MRLHLILLAFYLITQFRSIVVGISTLSSTLHSRIDEGRAASGLPDPIIVSAANRIYYRSGFPGRRPLSSSIGMRDRFIAIHRLRNVVCTNWRDDISLFTAVVNLALSRFPAQFYAYCAVTFPSNSLRLPVTLAIWAAQHPRTLVLGLLPVALSTGDYGAPSSPPTLDGTRCVFLSWVMVFSGYISWKLTDRADRAEWARHGRNLYGLLIQAVPDWLHASTYNDHRNNGVNALRHLRRLFDEFYANAHQLTQRATHNKFATRYSDCVPQAAAQARANPMPIKPYRQPAGTLVDGEIVFQWHHEKPIVVM